MALSSDAQSHERLGEILLAEPADAEREWRAWRAETPLDAMDADCLALLPLLSGRLADWIAGDEEGAKLLGICRRGWAENQLRLRELAEIWRQLQEAGAEPIAIGGEAALALIYAKERAVRSVTSLEIFLARSSVARAYELLREAGWRLEPHMPYPEGRVLDEYDGVWLRSQSPAALHLRWRLADVAPAFAAQNEPRPATAEIDLQGVRVRTLAPEELLYEILTRPSGIVDWTCDARMLLRNEALDWRRFYGTFSAPPKLHELREMSPGIPEPPPVPERTSLVQSWAHSYRNVAWAKGERRSLAGFAQYVGYRARAAVAYQSGVTRIDATGVRNSSALAEYARYRALFLFLTARDVRLRYRKTWRGVLWALVQPLLPMVLFAAIFARVLRPEIHFAPYWLFVLSGIGPWMFFSSAVNYASVTFVGNANLLNKIYFPRGILPAAAVAACLPDLFVSTGALIAASVMQHSLHGWILFELPPAMAAAALVALVVGVAAASLNVLYRDLKPLVPFLVQVAMYATPVLYPLSMVPAHWRWVAWLNPMTAIVEAFHASLFGLAVDWRGTGISALAFAAILLATGLIFRAVEADIAERA